MAKKQLTIDTLKEIWKDELLPSIKKEIRSELKKEVDQLNATIKEITKRCSTIEDYQSFQCKQ